MKTSWLQQEAAGCSHLPFQGADKTGNRFLPLQSPGELSVSHYIELSEKSGGGGGVMTGEHGGKGAR